MKNKAYGRWILMNKRIMSAAMAACIVLSFASCNLVGGQHPAETTVTETTEETTESSASEVTTTTEETTTEETETSEPAVTSSEETVTETTTATTAPSVSSSKKTSKKSTAPSIPKGYKKVSAGWGKKYKGHVVYIVRNKKSSRAYEFKGWWKNKWIKLDYDALGDEDGEIWYNDKYTDDYYSHKGKS